MNNIYQPHRMKVVSVTRQTADVRSVKIRFLDSEVAKNFSFRVGQFGLFSVFGVGESVFNICCTNSCDFIEFCFRKTGRVTESLAQIEPGDVIGFRGPYGNSYPMEDWEGKNLVFVGGGIAMPPIRCAIHYALEHRERFGKLTIVYGARTVADLVFADELDEWARHPNVEVIKTVDPGGETPHWNGKVGFVPTVLGEAQIDGDNTVALVVGPPVMIKFSLPVLSKAGVADDAIFTSLENRMKCGVGKCGRCNCGSVYVCKEGPVFSLTELNRLPNDY